MGLPQRCGRRFYARFACIAEPPYFQPAALAEHDARIEVAIEDSPKREAAKPWMQAHIGQCV